MIDNLDDEICVKHEIYGDVCFDYVEDSCINMSNNKNLNIGLFLNSDDDTNDLLESNSKMRMILDLYSEIEKEKNAKYKSAVLNYDKGIENFYVWYTQGEEENDKISTLKTKDEFINFITEHATFDISSLFLDDKYLIEGFEYTVTIEDEYQLILTVFFKKENEEYIIESHRVNVI